MSELDDLESRVAAMEAELALLRTSIDEYQREHGADASPSATRSSGPLSSQSTGATATRGPGAGPPRGPASPPKKGPGLFGRIRSAADSGEWSRDLEFLLGGNLLGKLGLFALVLAAAWFIKFAFDNRWINESGRIYTGLLVGFAVVGAGLWLAHRRYRVLGAAVTGTGFSILYIAFFGAFYFYDLVGRTESFVGLFVLSAALAVLAARGDSIALYLFSLLGAFMAPILLSSGENSYRFLFGYATIINLGFVAISTRRAWRGVAPVLLAANASLFFAWFSEHGHRSSFLVPYLYVLVLHLGLLVRERILFPERRGELYWDNHLVAALSHFVFFLATVFLGDQYLPEWTGHLLLVGAVVQLALFWQLRARLAGRLSARSLLVAESLVLVAYLVWVFAALTTYFEGRLLTMSWLVLAGALSALGAHIRSRRLIFASVPIWIVALFRLLLLEGRPWNYTLLANERFVLFLVAALLLSGTYWLQRRGPIAGWMRGFAFVAVAVLVIGSLRENRDFVSNPHYRNLGASYVMAAYALLLLVPGFVYGRASARWSGMVLAVIVVGKLFLYDVWTMSLLVRIIAFASLGVGLVIISYYYQRFRERLFPGGEES